jgi:hypothetical protein
VYYAPVNVDDLAQEFEAVGIEPHALVEAGLVHSVREPVVVLVGARSMSADGEGPSGV